MLGLAAATAVLGKIESVDKSALIAVGIMTGVLAGVAVILGIMDKLDISASIPNVIALSIMLNAICAAALIASKIPPIPPSASLYIAAFVGIITALGAVIVAVAGVIDLIPGVEEFLDGGIKILVKISEYIGFCAILRLPEQIPEYALCQPASSAKRKDSHHPDTSQLTPVPPLAFFYRRFFSIPLRAYGSRDIFPLGHIHTAAEGY